MPYPSITQSGYSYTAFQLGQGDNAFPGTEVDADFALVEADLQAIVNFIKIALRSDGKLNNGVVTRLSLAGDIHLGVGPPTVWVTATSYALGETVTVGPILYYCLTSHTSGVFATDLAAGKWTLLLDYSTAAVILPGAVGPTELAAGAVTAPKIAAGAVGLSAFAAGAVEAALAADGVAGAPIGAMLEFAGITPPARWAWANGATFVRAAKPALLAALSAAVTGATSFGTPDVTGLSQDLRGLGLIGAFVEGLGIAVGTTITALPSATTMTLSAAVSNTGTSPLLVLPWGQGDGSTTANLPDRRGRSGIGRDDMGGVAAARMTAATIDGTKLGAAGGSEAVVLSAAQMPTHDHGFVDGGHTHTVTGTTDAVARTVSGSTYNVLGGAVNILNSVIHGAANVTGTAASHSSNITFNSAGSSAAHPNVQPGLVENVIIFVGA